MLNAINARALKRILGASAIIFSTYFMISYDQGVSAPHFSEQQHATSCAFVANNPSLNVGYANEIDQHDRVIRFNNFWAKTCVKGPCDDVVGKKTTDTFLNCHRLIRIEELNPFPWKRCYFDLPPGNWSDNNPDFYSRADLRKYNCSFIDMKFRREAVSRIVKKAMHIKPDMVNDTLVIYPTTGYLGVMLLSSSCSGGVTFYGFSNNDTTVWHGHLFEIEHMILKEKHPNASWFV